MKLYDQMGWKDEWVALGLAQCHFTQTESETIAIIIIIIAVVGSTKQVSRFLPLFYHSYNTYPALPSRLPLIIETRKSYTLTLPFHITPVFNYHIITGNKTVHSFTNLAMISRPKIFIIISLIAISLSFSLSHQN